MVGISTACFFPMETEQTVPLIAELGFSCAEVFLQAEYEYDPAFLRSLSERLCSVGVRVHSVHAFCAAFEPHLFSEYERRRQDALAVFRTVVRAAQMLGAQCYSFHGNLLSATREGFDYARFADQMRELYDICRAEGVELAWENVSWCQSCDPDFLRRALEEIGPDEVSFTLDFKQARRAGHSPLEYLDVMGGAIKTVHINDSDASHSCLLPGAGTFAYEPVLEALVQNGYCGDFIIEVYRENFGELEEIVKSRQFVEMMLKKYRVF